MGMPVKPTRNNELVDVHYDGQYIVTYALRGGWKTSIYVRPPFGQFVANAWRALESLLRDVQGPIVFIEPSGDEVEPNPAVACQDATDGKERERDRIAGIELERDRALDAIEEQF